MKELAFTLPEGLDLNDNEKKGLQAIADHFEKQLKEYTSGLKSQDEFIDSICEKLKEKGWDKAQLDKLEKILKDQGTEITSLKEKKGTGEKYDFRKELKALISSDDFKEAMKDKKVRAIEIKAADTMMTPNVGTNAPHALTFEIVPGIQSAPREANAIFPALYKGTTNSRTIIWINRVNKDGGSAFIGEGKLKPLKDWEYAEENSVSKKIAVRTKVSTEMFQDFEYMEGEIRKLLNEDLFEIVDEKLLTGSAVDEPRGILNVAGGYTGNTGLEQLVREPNNADAVRAAILQMRLLNYKPNVLFINPADNAMLDLTKSTTGNYIRLELDALLRGLKIVETARIDQGNFLLVDTAKWNVKVHSAYRLEFGWENDDFSKNLVSVIAEMRLHSYGNSIDEGALLYENFDLIKTALEM